MARSTRQRRPKTQRRADGDAVALRSIVVLAFGPTNATRGLVKSYEKLARDLSARFLSVDALDPATGRPAGLGQRLRAALRTLEPGPVLLVHDDLAIDRHGIERLAAAHAEGAAVVVPLTNDRGTPHFHGSLPPATMARPKLKQLGHDATDAVEPVERIRTGCVFADRSTLDDLIDDRLHDPFTVLSDRGAGFHVATGAFAAHDGGCGAQVRAGATTDAPLLVASMIVKDEEQMLPGCLESLDGLVDRIEVVDTGSSDRTVEIAEAHGCVVSHVPWTDDFSAARNAAAERCRDAHFTLWIDADERVVTNDPALVRDVLGAHRDEFEALDVQLANRNDGPDAAPTSVFRARRLVRSDLLAFEGRVHEAPVRAGGGAPLDTTTFDLLGIDHLGYAEQIVADRDKGRRNLDLARSQYGDDDTVKASVDLARSLMLAGDASEEAIGLLREALERAGDTKLEWRVYLLASLAHLLVEVDEHAEAFELAHEAYAAMPTDDLAAAVFATAADAIGAHGALLEAAHAPVPAALPEPVFASPENRRRFEDLVLLATAAAGDAATAWSTVGAWPNDGALDATRADVFVGVAAHGFDGLELVEQLLLAAVASELHAELLGVAVRRIAPELSAVLALGLLESGVETPEVALTGSIAALVSGQAHLLDALMAHTHLLDIGQRRQLAERMERRGELAHAERLRSSAQSSPSLVARLGGGS